MVRLVFLRTNLSWPVVLADFGSSAHDDEPLFQSIFAAAAAATDETGAAKPFSICDTSRVGFGREIFKAVLVAGISISGSSRHEERCRALVDVVVAAMNKWSIRSSSDVCNHRYFHALCTELVAVAQESPSESSFYSEATRLWRVLDNRLNDRRGSPGSSGFFFKILEAPSISSEHVAPTSSSSVTTILPLVTQSKIPSSLAKGLFRSRSVAFGQQSNYDIGQQNVSPVAAAIPTPASPIRVPPVARPDPPRLATADQLPTRCDSPVQLVASAPPLSPDAAPAVSAPPMLPEPGQSGDTGWYFGASEAGGNALAMEVPLPPARELIPTAPSTRGVEEVLLPPVTMACAVQWPSINIRIDEKASVSVTGGVPSVTLSGTVVAELTRPTDDNEAVSSSPQLLQNFTLRTSPSAANGCDCERRTLRIRLSRWKHGSDEKGAAADLCLAADEHEDQASDDVVDLEPAAGVELVRSMSRGVELAFFIARTFDHRSTGMTNEVELATYTVDDHSRDEQDLLAPARCRTQWKVQVDGSGPERRAAHLFKCLVHLEPPPHGEGSFHFTSASLSFTPHRLATDGMMEVIAQPELTRRSAPLASDEECYAWLLDPSVSKHVLAAKFVQQAPEELAEDDIRKELKQAQKLILCFTADGCLSGLRAAVGGSSFKPLVTFRTVEGTVVFTE